MRFFRGLFSLFIAFSIVGGIVAGCLSGIGFLLLIIPAAGTIIYASASSEDRQSMINDALQSELFRTMDYNNKIEKSTQEYTEIETKIYNDISKQSGKKMFGFIIGTTIVLLPPVIETFTNTTVNAICEHCRRIDSQLTENFKQYPLQGLQTEIEAKLYLAIACQNI